MGSKSSGEVKRMFDLGRQYDVFEPWLKENGFEVTDLPLTAEMEDSKEFVIVDAYHDENGDLVWRTTTAQDNGWLRTNIYYKDGATEELYEKERKER